MKSAAWGCGCFLKVFVCPKHMDAAAEQLQSQVQLMRDQLDLGLDLAYEVREGSEAGEDGLPF